MKKFNADSITRTVIYSDGKAVKANLETMTMEEFSFRVIGTYEANDLLDKVKQMYGTDVVGIKSVEHHEEKRKISVTDFILYSEVVTTKEDEA